MAPRTNVIPHHISIPTPAPLLPTTFGQLPFLPPPLLSLAIPPGHPPLLLQLALLDWHTLNPNTPLYGKDLFQNLERNGVDRAGHDVRSYANLGESCLFLCNRAAGSGELLTDTPGKKDIVIATGRSRREEITPEGLRQLHESLGTDYVTSLCDYSPLPNGRVGALKRRIQRAERMRVKMGQSKGILTTICGGDVVQLWEECAKQSSGDIILDGLWAGESLDVRWKCIEAVTKAHSGGLRVLNCGLGTPQECLRAVERGIDVIASAFPFEMAKDGIGIDLERGERVNLRERKWMRDNGRIVEGCECGVCQRFGRGYLRHLLEVHEMMGVSFVAAHNLWQWLKWWEGMRKAVNEGWGRFVNEFERRRTHLMRHCNAAYR